MTKIVAEGLAYDDVLLIPQKSFVDHRGEVSTKTHLTKNIELSIPFISANMDTVTESEMAIALAREGGMGIIHRFMTIEEQVREVERVKRSVGFVLEDPYTVTPNMTLGDVWKVTKENKIDGFIVVDEKNKVLGILSRRDILFETNPEKLVRDCMTPFSKLIVGKPTTNLTEAKKLFKENRIEKLPLVDTQKVLKGLITAKAVRNYEQYPHATKDKYGRYRVGAAIGVVNDFLDRAKALVDADVDTLVIDVAHGHNNIALKAVSEVRKKFKNIDIIGGNVATKEGALDLIARGVDAVKVGVGPGGLCTTRIVAGVGYPQLSAVMECAEAVKKTGVPIIADGGTNFPGDMAKALSAGASVCMLAGWFAGTDESPGGIILRNGLKYKVHRGSASFLSTADRKLRLENNTEEQLNKIVPEGVEALVPYKGKVSDVIFQLTGALRSGMSYCNAKSIPDLWKNAKFVKITEAGFRESKSHNVQEL